MSKTIDRIRKLLALANNSGATESEADSARRMADALMEAAGVTESDIPDGEADPAATVRAENRGRAPARWSRTLAHAVSLVLGCRVYTRKGYGGPPTMVWVGTDTQREAGEAMHQWLEREVNALARRYRGVTDSTRARSTMAAYRMGVAITVLDKAQLMVKAREAEAVGAALVRRDAVKAAIARHLPPRLTKSTQVNIRDEGAFHAGRAAGAAIELQRKVGAQGAGPLRLRSGS
jgi:hypothetical protein